MIPAQLLSITLSSWARELLQQSRIKRQLTAYFISLKRLFSETNLDGFWALDNLSDRCRHMFQNLLVTIFLTKIY